MRIIGICTVIFLFLICALFWGSGKVIGYFLKADKIAELLKNQTGLELLVDNLKVKAKPNLILTAGFDDLKILTPEKKILLSAGKSNFQIKILPLITKKVVLKGLHSDTLTLDILREKDGKFEFEKYFNPEKKSAFTFDLSGGKIDIKNYKIDLTDKFLNSKSTVKGEELIAQKTKELLELKTRGEITTKSGPLQTANAAQSSYELDLKTKLPYKKYLANKNFKFNVNLKNLDISQYSGYLKDLKNTKGIFDVEISTDDNKIDADILVKNLEIPDKKFDVKANGNLQISALAFVESDFIQLENFSLAGKGIDLEGKGKIYDYKNKKPELDLEFKIKDTNGKNAIALLPNLIPTPENSIFKLKKYAADGTLNGQITIGGRAPKPVIKGIATYKDVTILNRKLKIPTSHGDIEFCGDWARMYARAFVEKDQYIDVKGDFGLYRNRKANFEIVSTKNANIKNAQILVLPIQDIIGFKTGPIPVMELSGNGTLNLKTSGDKQSAALYGFFEFNNVRAKMLNGFETPIEKASGKILFNKDKITFDGIKGKFNTADLAINGQADVLGNVEMQFISKNLSNKDIWRIIQDNFDPKIAKNYAILDKIKFQASVVFGFKHKFNPSDLYNAVQPKDLGFFGRATGVNSPNSDIYFHSGEVVLKDNKAYFNNLDATLFGSDILANFTVDKVFDVPPQQITNGKITLKNFDFAKISEIGGLTNADVQKILANFNNFSGKLNGVLLITNNNLSGKLDLEGIEAVDKNNTPIKIASGQVEVRNNKLLLNRLSMNYGTVPFYLNVNVNDMYSKNSPFDIHFTTSLSEENVDVLINPHLSYPLDVKGEVGLKGMLKGSADDYTLYLKATLEPQNDISYMGATLGDRELKREIRTNINFKGNVAKIRNFEYLKYVSSQNNKLTPVPVLRAFGDVTRVDKDNVSLRNFNVKTESPATARIFNVIFKKSILKQGQFSCNLVLNEDIKNLKVLGKIDFSDINIPLYNSKIQNASFNFRESLIRASLSGKAYDSDINIVSEIKNEFKLPVIVKKLEITSLKTDIGKIVDELSIIGAGPKGGVVTTKDQIIFGPNDIIVEEGSTSAADVTMYDVKAKNFSGKFNKLAGAPFKFYDTSFDIAGGKIVSDGTFDFDTTKLTLNSRIENCEANTLSQSFFGIPNQIFGNMNGEFYLTGSKLNTPAGLKTVEARASFNVENGKMPRLGSIEYLIRAGNVYKSGILGLTINNIIEVLTPYKTGDFSQIKGSMLIQSGVIEKLEILSKGENLSIFVHGTYDLVNNAADIEVLGRLSKKVSNLLGPIGNASFNSLFGLFGGKKASTLAENELVQNINKIPLIEISQNDYRIFTVKIMGDLNKEGYVKTFNWLN